MESTPVTPTSQAEKVVTTTSSNIEVSRALGSQALAVIAERRLSPEEAELTLSTLEERFQTRNYLHRGCDWDRVKAALEANPGALWSISQMEKNGHEPNVYNFDDRGFNIGTCSVETPVSSRNCVYDAQAAAFLKENYPNNIFNGNAVEMAEAMGISLMTQSEYEQILQDKWEFDSQSCSWLLTYAELRDRNYANSGRRRRESSLRLVHEVGAINHRDDTGWRGSLRVSWAV